MRKLFGTDGIRGEFGQFPLDEETISKVGKTARFLGQKVLIGRDPRISGAEIEKILVKNLTSIGIDVYLVGIITTPGVSYLTQELGMDFGIMISASHNPYQDNGLKFFDQKGMKLKTEIEKKIEVLISEEENLITDHSGDIFDIESKQKLYFNFLKNSSQDLSGLKILLDCANGAASNIAPQVFSELGARVIVLNNHPDGKNINQNCGAVYPEFLKEKVVDLGVDMGITLDGDADRLVLLDEQGQVLDGDFILAIAGYYLKEKNKLKHNLVVSTVMANLGLFRALEKQEIKLIQTKVGDKYLIEEMIKKGAVLGGEQSGHILFLDYLSSGDGILSALQILKIMKKKNKKLSELGSILQKYPQILINVKVNEKKPVEEIGQVGQKIKEVETKLGKEGRVLVRYSGTQNLLRVMIEGQDKDLITRYAQEIAEEIRTEIGV